MARFKALRPRRTAAQGLKMRQFLGKIRITVFLGKNVKFHRGKPPELAGNTKFILEGNLREGCFTSLRTMAGLPEVSKYLTEVVLPSAWYRQITNAWAGK